MPEICFNPCFNGSMYKNRPRAKEPDVPNWVSILVLMDLCIKTVQDACRLLEK